MFNIKAQMLELISVASHVLATMGLFHVRFGARPQAKPSIISVYKLSPISKMSRGRRVQIYQNF